MNVFILSTGRCGSMTFSKACQHITNYTAAHESRLKLIGPERLAFPQNHIESDNRLCWLLGRLDLLYGDRAFYVHLYRNPDEVARSYAQRHQFGIMKAYREGFLLGGMPGQSHIDLAYDYIDTLEANIRLFLRDKSQQMEFRLEHACDDFTIFWERIAAQGDLAAALSEWQQNYNASLE